MTQQQLFGIFVPALPMSMTNDQFAELLGVLLRRDAEKKPEPLPALAKVIVEKIAEGIPPTVVGAIAKAWPDQAVEMLTSLKHNLDHYYLERWNMYIGIEYDGYIHT